MSSDDPNIEFSYRFAAVLILFSLISLIGATLFLTNPIASADSSHSNSTEPFWTNSSWMPTPRSESGVAMLEDKIYVAGGESDAIKKTNVIEVYDLKTKMWSTVASLPIAMNHVGMSSYDGKLYAVGGTHDNGYSNKLFIYDPKAGKWSEGKSMPAARTALTVNFIDDKLYAVGGVDDVHNVANTNLVYDPKNDSWVEKAPMPTARHHLTSSVVAGKLYVIGGRLLGDGIPAPIAEGLSNFNVNEMYDPVNDKWTTLEKMPSNRSGLASAAIGDYIYVFGGQKVNGTFENNERYDTKNNIWTTEKPVPTPRLGLKAVAVGDDIFVIGGKTWDYFAGSVEIFHPKK
jgi:N-acetylneuraminic acid mutarotase